MSQISILEEFSALAPQLPALVTVLETELRERLAGFKIHSLAARIKSQEALKQKIARPDRNYTNLYDITDLIGFRVVTYSEELILEVARAVETSFDVDYRHSTNKLRFDDDRRFGYRSLHYVAKVPESLRGRFPEKLRFEIQIRTSLQHTWAEIEHGLGYKASTELPWAFRRRFSQIASLLEIADRDFDHLRRDIEAYEKKVRGHVDEDLALDEISLRSLLGHPEIADLDQKISAAIGTVRSAEDFFPDYLIRMLQAADIKTVRDVLEAVKSHGGSLASFVRPYFDFSTKHWNFGEKSVAEVKRGYSLLFIAHLAILASETLLIDKLKRVSRFYQLIDFPDNPAKAEAAGNELIAQLKAHKLL